MRYDFACTNGSCGNVIEDDVKLAERDAHHPACPKCGSPCNYRFAATIVHTILKDGPSGSWPSKGERFKKYRARQSVAAEKRQNERFGMAKESLPNYKGQETGTWREAKDLAVADKGQDIGKTYDRKIKAEDAKKIT